MFKKTNLNFQMVNKPAWNSPQELEVIDLYRLSFILLVNNNRKGRGGRLKKEVGAYIYFLPLKKEGLLERLELRGGGYLRGGA